MKKLSLKILTASALLGTGLFFVPYNVNAEAVADAPGSQSSSGWVKDGGYWNYLDSEGNRVTGWHYLKSKTSDKEKWYLFDNGGHLVSFVPKNSINLFNTNIDEPFSTSDHPNLKNGWYELSGKDGFYLEGALNGEYHLSVYSDGSWNSLDVKGAEGGGTLSANKKNSDDTQKWWISQNKGGSYTLINKATGLQFAISGNNLTSYKGIDQKTVSLKRVGARPEYYGAVGDGVTDDTDAILRTIELNDTVEFAKRYNTSETITIKKDNLKLIGDNGMIVTHTGFPTFRVKGKNVTFDNVIFMGSYTRDEASDYGCIYFKTDSSDPEVVDYNANIVNCKFINTGLRGIHIHSERVSSSDFTPKNIASNITIKDCTFDSYKIGVCCSGPDNVTVDHCTFSNAYYEHVTFDWRSRHCKAVNNSFNGLEGGIGAVGIDSAEDIEIKNNDFNYSVLYGITLSAQTRTNNNVVISDNTFNYTGGLGGIRFNKYEVGPAANNVTISNNTFNTDNSYSIKVESAGQNIKFTGNTYNSDKPVISNSDSQIETDY